MANIRRRTKRIGHNNNERIAQAQRLFSLINMLAVHRAPPRITPAIILTSQRISISGQSRQANSLACSRKATRWCCLGTAKLLKNSSTHLTTFLPELPTLHPAWTKWASTIKAQRWTKKHQNPTSNTKVKANRWASSQPTPTKLAHPSWRIEES